MVVLAFLFAVGAVWQFVHSGLPHFEKVVYTWLGDDSGKLVFPTYSGKTAEFKAKPASCSILSRASGCCL